MTYVCPMHPEVQAPSAGSCPKCGMALERDVPTADAEEDPELASMRARFRVAGPLAAVLLALAMADMFSDGAVARSLGTLAAGARLSWVELVLATPVVVWGGAPLFARGVEGLAHRSPNMFTLIGLGTAAAYAYSLVATLAPGLLPEVRETCSLRRSTSRPRPSSSRSSFSARCSSCEPARRTGERAPRSC